MNTNKKHPEKSLSHENEGKAAISTATMPHCLSRGKRILLISIAAILTSMLVICGPLNQAHASLLDDVGNTVKKIVKKSGITQPGDTSVQIMLSNEGGSVSISKSTQSQSQKKSQKKAQKKPKKETLQAGNITLLTTRYTYNGQARKPAVRVTNSQGKTLVQNQDFTVRYISNTKPGSAKVNITFKGDYAGSCTKYFSIEKGKNSLNAKDKKVIIQQAKVKKKAQTIQKNSAFTVKNAKGKVTFKKISGSKALSVNSTGKVTVKKGTKKGTYSVKVKVTAAGNTLYHKGSDTMKLTVVVK